MTFDFAGPFFLIYLTKGPFYYRYFTITKIDCFFLKKLNFKKAHFVSIVNNL
jgi:hypothetical protein